jgi:hypothetical protein
VGVEGMGTAGHQCRADLANRFCLRDALVTSRIAFSVRMEEYQPLDWSPNNRESSPLRTPTVSVTPRTARSVPAT